MAIESFQKTRDAKKDSRLIRKLANEGFTICEICQQTGLNNSQVYYSLTRWYSDNVARSVRKTLNENKKKGSVSSTMVKKEISPIASAQQVSNNPIIPMEEAVLLDTSIINLYYLVNTLNEMKNVVFIFPSIVIDELENMKKRFTGFKGRNIRALLTIALETKNKIVPTKLESSLTGWRDNNDSLIVQTAMEISNQFKLTLYTCDKGVALKAKSFGLEYMYFKPDLDSVMESFSSFQPQQPVVPLQQSIPIQKNQNEFNLFLSVIDQINETRTLEFVRQKGFCYIKDSIDFPYFYKYSSGNILTLAGKQRCLRRGDIIYKIEKDGIEQYSLQSFSETNNALLIKRAIFKAAITEITLMHISLCIQSLL